MEKNQIIGEILNYMNKNGGPGKQWYVGISDDAPTRLFTDHKVETNGVHIYLIAESNKEAREIEAFFINKIRTDGGPGGGDKESKMVYAYKKTTLTNP